MTLPVDRTRTSPPTRSRPGAGPSASRSTSVPRPASAPTRPVVPARPVVPVVLPAPATPLVAHAGVRLVGPVAAVVAVVVSLVSAAVLPDAGRQVAVGAVAVLLIALGSPHGALDHLVVAADGRPATSRPGGGPDRRDADRPTRRSRFLRPLLARLAPGLTARFVAVYASVAVVSLLAYLALPRVGFGLFLLLSVAHFAGGEAAVALERGTASGRRDPLAWASALGGAVIVVVPLAMPEARAALAAVDPALAPALAPVPVLAVAVGGLWLLATVCCAVGAARGSAAARTTAVELLVLMTLAVLAHPLLAFATYFAFWHSLRHQARIADLTAAPVSGSALRRVLSSAGPGLPATVAVLGVAVVLVALGSTALGALLAVVWALTVPHSLVVARHDLPGLRSWPGGRRRRADRG